jgi:hypothetical protein
MATVKTATTINAATQQYAMPQIEGFILSVILFPPVDIGRQPRGVALTPIQSTPNPVPDG